MPDLPNKIQNLGEDVIATSKGPARGWMSAVRAVRTLLWTLGGLG